MAFFSWWYGEGWARQLSRVADRMMMLLDMFSFELLLRTFFAPFRQISAGPADGPIGRQLRMIVDKLVSRFIGSMVRGAVLIAGVIILFLAAVAGCIQLVVWPLMPWAPLIGCALALTGWMPWR